MFIDTHCHLDFEDYNKDRDEVISLALESGVQYLINIGSSLKASQDSITLAARYNNVFAAVGVHPHDAEGVSEETISTLKNMAETTDKVVAIGEVGLDYYRDIPPHDVQKKVFIDFIHLSRDLNLPLILHVRGSSDPGHCPDAYIELLEILKKELTTPIKGVVHCFSGDEEFLNEVLKLGLHVSFTANITFRSHNKIPESVLRLRQLVKKVPDERLLLETDSPFLAPQEFRGKRNQPAYIKYTAEKLAQLRNVSIEDIARITSLNACRLFNIKMGEEFKPEIAYQIRDSLYLNITNRCTDNCTFCVRGWTDYVKGHNLRLEDEPAAEEILKEIGDPSKYKEIVFCGYGEPTIRLDLLLNVSKKLKEKGAYIRLNTNGHGNLIHGGSIVGKLVGLIDEVSVSLNVDTKSRYNELCKPVFGPDTFDRIKEFVLECKRLLPKVGITVLNMPGIDLKECERIAKEELGVELRIREYNVVG